VPSVQLSKMITMRSILRVWDSRASTVRAMSDSSLCAGTNATMPCVRGFTCANSRRVSKPRRPFRATSDADESFARPASSKPASDNSSAATSASITVSSTTVWFPDGAPAGNSRTGRAGSSMVMRDSLGVS
jgi:hypothetical protein